MMRSTRSFAAISARISHPTGDAMNWLEATTGIEPVYAVLQTAP